MTWIILESWLRNLNKTMSEWRRKVVLIVDNCAAHPKVQNLKAMELAFLPPNITSKRQPCDMGIINSLKSFYRTSLLRRLVQHIDDDKTLETFKPTLLQAILLLKLSGAGSNLQLSSFA